MCCAPAGSRRLLTLAGDGGKGGSPCFAARYGVDGPGAGGSARRRVLGHLFSVFLGFRGGKGVATAGGVLFAFDPWLGDGGGATWLFMAPGVPLRIAGVRRRGRARAGLRLFMSLQGSAVLALARSGC